MTKEDVLTGRWTQCQETPVQTRLQVQGSLQPASCHLSYSLGYLGSRFYLGLCSRRKYKEKDNWKEQSKGHSFKVF